MTGSDIHDLKIWKANIEYILAERRRKLDSVNKIIQYAERNPKVISMTCLFREQRPDLIRTIEHLEKTITEINHILGAYDEIKRVNHNKGNAEQAAGRSEERERNFFVRLQNEKALLAN